MCTLLLRLQVLSKPLRTSRIVRCVTPCAQGAASCLTKVLIVRARVLTFARFATEVGKLYANLELRIVKCGTSIKLPTGHPQRALLLATIVVSAILSFALVAAGIVTSSGRRWRMCSRLCTPPTGPPGRVTCVFMFPV